MKSSKNAPDPRPAILKRGAPSPGAADKPVAFATVLSLGILALVFAATGCKPQGPPQQQGPEAAVVTLQPERVAITTELPGRTAAYLDAEIRPQINGIIQKRLFVEGSDVKAGQVLYQIDPAPFQAALDNATASLAKAEAGLLSVRSKAERYREVLADKAVSQQDYDDVVASMKQAEAEIQFWKASVRTATINLRYTRVTAPISGRVGTSSVTDGDIVTAYQPAAMATIQQLDPIYVDVPQSATDLLRFRRSVKDGSLNHNDKTQNKVKLVLADGTPYPLEGTLQFKDVTVDPTTGSVILRAIFPNPETILLPGMFVREFITEGVNERAILVPQQGVSRTPKGDPVALIVDAQGKAEQRMLTLDRAIGDKWLVSKGLAAGDKVIVEGAQKVMPGAVVKAVPFDAGPREGQATENTVQPTAGVK